MVHQNLHQQVLGGRLVEKRRLHDGALKEKEEARGRFFRVRDGFGAPLQAGGQRIKKQRALLGDQLLNLGHREGEGIEHHDEAVPVAAADQLVQLLPLSRLVPREVELVDIIADGFEEHARHQHEDFVLALEIVVDQPGRHVGALRDVLDGGGFVGTLFQHAGLQRAPDLDAALLGD